MPTVETRQIIFSHHRPIPGIPFTVIPDEAMVRICKNFSRDVNDLGCWKYRSATGRKNIGFVKDGKLIHITGARLALLLLHDEPIPVGKTANHSCPHIWCVAPTHIYAGSHTDNMLDSYVDGRRAPPKRPRAPSRLRASAAEHERLLRERAARVGQTIQCTRFFCDEVREEIRGRPAL